MPGPVEFNITNNNLPLIAQLDQLMKQAISQALREKGDQMMIDAVLAIQYQHPPNGESWLPLSESYVKWKQKKGFSEQIYLMTSSYQQAITWKTDRTDTDFTLIVGVLRTSGPGQWGKTDIWKVAELLEYGNVQFNVKFPPRPLWRPLLEQHRRSIQTRVGAAIYWSAKKIEAQAKGKVGI